MEYKMAICDDIDEDVQYLTSVVQSWAQKQKVSVNIETFVSAESFLFRYEEKKDYDIILLDVEMKKISGIELAKKFVLWIIAWKSSLLPPISNYQEKGMKWMRCIIS